MESAKEQMTYRWMSQISDLGVKDGIYWIELDGLPARIWLGSTPHNFALGDEVKITIERYK